MKKPITITTDSEIIEAIKKEAEKERRSLSQMASVLFEEALAARREQEED